MRTRRRESERRSTRVRLDNAVIAELDEIRRLSGRLYSRAGLIAELVSERRLKPKSDSVREVPTKHYEWGAPLAHE